MHRRHEQVADTPLAGDTVRAFAHVHSHEIAYRRGGRGRPVLLLAADALQGESLGPRLAEHFKVIAPELPVPGDAEGIATWLPAFVETLGLSHLHLVATDQYAACALHFALGETDRLDRIAVLWRERAGDEVCEVERAHTDYLHRSDRPLLLLRLPPTVPGADTRDSTIITALVRFLMG